MLIQLLAGSLLLALLLAAVWSDIASRRIPNWLVLAGLIAGLACQLFLPRGGGFFSLDPGSLRFDRALLGLLTGGGMLLPLYALRAMGAGDVKLMAAVGVFLGPLQAAGAVLLTFLAGGVLSIAAALFSRSFGQVMNNLRLMLLYLVAGKEAGFKLSDAPTSGRLPYALAIFAGTALQIALARYTEWWFA